MSPGPGVAVVEPWGVCPNCLCVFTTEVTVRKAGLGSWPYYFLAVSAWATGKIFQSLSLLGSKMRLKCLPLRGMPTYWGDGKDDAKKWLA